MIFNPDYTITINKNEHFSIERIKRECENHPHSKILIEVQNTKGITSSMIKELPNNVAIRIAGGFDEERCKNGLFKGNGYIESVIYTKNETIKILEEIERIESGLNRNWSDIQKLIYIYDKLKSGIMYDPKYEEKLSSEIRSLRGLITKQTVCAGYALILKEFMDRNNIECEYVEGYTKANKTGGHSWNIITIDDKKYPIDLTWDNTRFRSGKSKTFDLLGQDIKSFSKNHHPAPGEKTQDYIHTLSEINPQLIKMVYSLIGLGRERGFSSTTYKGRRKDGSKYIVAQIGDNKINGTDYYRYYYIDINEEGKKQIPIILYSETNLAHLINCKRFKKPIPQGYEAAVDLLFSKENINDSLSRKTFYIGKVKKSSKGNKLNLISSLDEIKKPDNKKDLFTYPTRVYTRSDGSTFIVQQMLKKPHEAKGVNVMRYDIFELVNENGEETLKRNTVFTEKKLFQDTRQSMIDNFLSRELLDKTSKNYGGYIGNYNVNEEIIYNPNLVSFFETSKRIDIDTLKEKQDSNESYEIPTFEELKQLVSKYEIYIDSDDILNIDPSNIKIRDIKTHEIITNEELIEKATFANIWLTSAGVKYIEGEKRPGETYAFNAQAEDLYSIICEELKKTSKNNGVIDTISLYKKIEEYTNYKHSKQIIIDLFRTPFQTELINKMFLSSVGIKYPFETPQPLYSTSHISTLLNDNNCSK